MNQEILNQIKQQLLTKKQALAEKLSQFAEKNPDRQDDYQTKFPNYGDEEEENVAEVATFVNNLSLEQNLEAELQEINKALEGGQNSGSSTPAVSDSLAALKAKMGVK